MYKFTSNINFNALVLTVISAIIVGTLIEVNAVRHGKKDKVFVYQYNSKFTLGPKVLGTPIEDSVIFLIFTPIFLVLVYEFISKII